MQTLRDAGLSEACWKTAETAEMVGIVPMHGAPTCACREIRARSKTETQRIFV